LLILRSYIVIFVEMHAKIGRNVSYKVVKGQQISNLHTFDNFSPKRFDLIYKKILHLTIIIYIKQLFRFVVK